MFLMDTGVTNIPHDMYPTTASGWRQVGRKGTAECVLHIALYIYIYIYIYICIYMCVCVCVCIRVHMYKGVYLYWNFIRLEIRFLWNYSFIFFSVNFQNYI